MSSATWTGSNETTPFGRDRTKSPLAVWLREDTHYRWLHLSYLWIDEAFGVGAGDAGSLSASRSRE